MIQTIKMFPDNAAAKWWVIRAGRLDAPECPHCKAGPKRVQSGTAHKTMRLGSWDCRKRSLVRRGTFMQDPGLEGQVWAMAIYQFTTNLKGGSSTKLYRWSTKLYRYLSIARNLARHLSHSIRFELSQCGTSCAGAAEVEETEMGGKRKNVPNHVHKELSERDPAGETAVVGARDRETSTVAAKTVESTDKKTLQCSVKGHADRKPTVYAAEAGADEALLLEHESAKHSVGEYVGGPTYTDGVESFWSMLKRGHIGTYHKVGTRHLRRYLHKFSGRHSVRESNMIDIGGSVLLEMNANQIKYEDLVKGDGLDLRSWAATA